MSELEPRSSGKRRPSDFFEKGPGRKRYGIRFAAPILAALATGVILGGYLFRNTAPRSILALDRCEQTCLSSREILGLLASVGVQNFKGALPAIIKETDKSIALKHPFPAAKIHYLIIPKKDIRDIASIRDEDVAYLADAFRVISVIVKERGLVKYKVITNGPGYQHVNYLHFHLMAN